jgi:hypothetical protein
VQGPGMAAAVVVISPGEANDNEANGHRACGAGVGREPAGRGRGRRRTSARTPTAVNIPLPRCVRARQGFQLAPPKRACGGGAETVGRPNFALHPRTPGVPMSPAPELAASSPRPALSAARRAAGGVHSSPALPSPTDIR